MDYFSIVIETQMEIGNRFCILHCLLTHFEMSIDDYCEELAGKELLRNSAGFLYFFFPMLAATGAASSSAATQRVAPLCRSPRSSHGVRFSALLLRASTAVGASLVPSVQVGSPADQKPYEFCSIFFKIPKILS